MTDKESAATTVEVDENCGCADTAGVGVRPLAAVACPHVDSPPGDGTAIIRPDGTLVGYGTVPLGVLASMQAWILDNAGNTAGPYVVSGTANGAPPEVPPGEGWYTLCPTTAASCKFKITAKNGNYNCSSTVPFNR
jgi:hypothetical protein